MLTGANITNILRNMMLCNFACMHRRFRGTCCGLRIYLVFNVFWLIVFGIDKGGNSFVYSFGAYVDWLINPLKTKRRPLYLKTQSVPRSKHFSSRL